MTSLLSRPTAVINVGLEHFAADLVTLGAPVVHVDWTPPAGGDPRLAELLASLDRRREAIERANRQVFDRLVQGTPFLVDCRPAREALGLPDRTVLHAGPPLDWTRACEPMRAAVLCAVRYEGWAPDDDAAARLVEAGAVTLAPCHDFGAVGPMTGMITASMPVLLVENRAWGNRGGAAINEGLGRVLRFGANDDTVLARLRWLDAECGPLLGLALRECGGLDLRALMAQALRMGDEMHQRNVAASSLLARALMAPLARVSSSNMVHTRVAEFVAGNDQFFLNVAMATGKALT